MAEIIKVRPAKDTPRTCMNSVDQVCKVGGGPIISRSEMPGRGIHYFGWEVGYWGEKGHIVLDPKASWYHYGNQWFKELDEALAWAEQTFGIKEWARNRMLDYIPADVAKRFPLRKL